MYLPSHSYGLWNSKLSSARTLRIKRPQTLKHKALSLVGESFSFFFLCKYYLDFFKGQRTCQFIEVTPWLEIMNFEEHGLDFSTQLDCRRAGLQAMVETVWIWTRGVGVPTERTSTMPQYADAGCIMRG